MHIFHAVEPQGLDGVILPKNLERQFSDAFGMWFREQLKRCVHMRFPQATPTIHCLSVYNIYIFQFMTHIIFTYVYTYAHTHTRTHPHTPDSHIFAAAVLTTMQVYALIPLLSLLFGQKCCGTS